MRHQVDIDRCGRCSLEHEDGAANLTPMSSAFWLRWRGVLDLAASSKTSENLLRTGEAVRNLPSDALASAVDRLALTTGSDPVPVRKFRLGYRYVPGKFERAGLTPVGSETAAALRVAECPVAMEVAVEDVHGLAEQDPAQRGGVTTFEVRVQWGSCMTTSGCPPLTTT